MPTTRLLDKVLRSFDASRRTELWDEIIRGFGVRVSPRGRKTFFVMYRKHGVRRRLKLGHYPRLSLQDARKKARAALGAVAEGGDPARERAAARRAPTFEELAAEWLERYAKRRKRGWRKDERVLDLDLLPLLGKMKAGEIGRSDVRRLLDGIVERGAPIQANRTRALLSRIFSWGVEQEIVEHNPCSGVRPPSPESRRERVLAETEIKQLWLGLEGEHRVIAAAFRLLLLTGQRTIEVLTMRWSDVDGDLWTIPAEVVKSKRAHLVPLPAQALGVIQGVGRRDSEWVLPSHRRRGSRLSDTALSHVARRLGGRLGWTFWPHDLRRTCASLIRGLGVERFTVERILNHADPSVTAIYDLYSNLPEKRRALALWGEHVAGIVSIGRDPACGYGTEEPVVAPILAQRV